MSELSDKESDENPFYSQGSPSIEVADNIGMRLVQCISTFYNSCDSILLSDKSDETLFSHNVHPPLRLQKIMCLVQCISTFI